MLVTGCAGLDEGPAWTMPYVTDLEAEVDADLPTTLHVRWDVLWVDPSSVTAPYVAFDDGDGHHGEVDATLTAEGSFEAVVYALRPDTDYALGVGGDADSGPFFSAEQTFTTGPLPTYLPEVELWGEPRKSGHLVTSIVNDNPYPVILNARGEFVWWHEPEERGKAVLRATLSRDGGSVIWLAEDCGTDIDTPCASTLRTARLDGSGESEVAIPYAHHDFVELDDGTIAVISREFLELDGEPWAVDRIEEVGSDGELYPVWSGWDSLALDPDTEPEANGVVDVPHANALDYVPSMDAYVIGLKHLSSLVAVDRSSGETLWKLGGAESDFALAPGADARWFVNQHQFHLTDERVVLFDNGLDSSSVSRVVEYDLGPQTTDAVAQVWQYEPDPGLYCYALGDVSAIGEDHLLVTWATAGIVEEVTLEREPLWQLRFDLGQGVGYTTWVDELY